MLSNLQFFKQHKYNAVLVRFDCTEDIAKLAAMVNDIKSSGFEVFAVYVGKDNMRPRWNPFIEPNAIESYMQVIAPKCTGLFLNWRSTSSHAKILPAEFFNYICSIARMYNS